MYQYLKRCHCAPAFLATLNPIQSVQYYKAPPHPLLNKADLTAHTVYFKRRRGEVHARSDQTAVAAKYRITFGDSGGHFAIFKHFIHGMLGSVTNKNARSAIGIKITNYEIFSSVVL